MKLQSILGSWPSRRSKSFRFSLSFILLMVFLVVLWCAGGASREDVAGQIGVRLVAWGSVGAMALFAPVPAFRQERPVLIFLILALSLALVQLVPLPPFLWQALPGRALITDAATISGQPQPWRPLSLVPGATVNAAASLIVPFATLLLFVGLRDEEKRLLPLALLGLIIASMLLALVQFSGSRFNNPLINDTIGQISASFANRNHLALFLAYGCLLAPAWACSRQANSTLRLTIALGVVALLVLTILATGSRAGLLLGVIALCVAFLLVQHRARRTMRHYPRWVLPALVLSSVGAMGLALLVAVGNHRAVSIDRIFAEGGAEDLRSRALPTVLGMIKTYFPVGSGLGGFDTVFRIHEPDALLKLTHYNHAHNDLLEAVLDTGLLGALVLLCAILWWGWASLRAWRAGPDAMTGRLGSAMLGLTLIASLFDYPARTPMIMTVIILAALWLAENEIQPKRPALRVGRDDL